MSTSELQREALPPVSSVHRMEVDDDPDDVSGIAESHEDDAEYANNAQDMEIDHPADLKRSHSSSYLSLNFRSHPLSLTS